jgi:hypothetical protein
MVQKLVKISPNVRLKRTRAPQISIGGISRAFDTIREGEPRANDTSPPDESTSYHDAFIKPDKVPESRRKGGVACRTERIDAELVFETSHQNREAQ